MISIPKRPAPASLTLVVGVCVLAGVFSHAHPARAEHPGDCGYPADTPLPAGPAVTAQQVEDGSATLGEFMLAARVRFDELHHEVTSFGESLQVHCLTRQEGSAWRSGSTYLVSLTADGRVWQHAKSLGLSGRLLKPLIYGAILQAAGINPAELTDRASAAEAFAAAGTGGLFDLPDIPGASGFAFAAPTLSFWIAGFEIDETHLVPVAGGRDRVRRPGRYRQRRGGPGHPEDLRRRSVGLLLSDMGFRRSNGDRETPDCLAG